MNQNRFVAGLAPRPLLHAPLSWPPVTYFCRKCLVTACPTQRLVATGLVTSQEIVLAAQASCKPFDSQPSVFSIARASELTAESGVSLHVGLLFGGCRTGTPVLQNAEIAKLTTSITRATWPFPGCLPTYLHRSACVGIPSLRFRFMNCAPLALQEDSIFKP